MLEEIRREILACTRCALSKGRTNAVPGEGPQDAQIMLVGEGPGEQEDRYGRPFVGPAGHFLNELLEYAGLTREQVFITNIVKCRPPGNRTPKPEEVAACNDYLIGQIAAIRPKVVCTLGSPALRTLLDERASISRVHGQPRKVSGILYVPLYHPAAALHQQSLRETIIEDMKRLRAILDAQR
jgi:uracil-DNA glycosylase family 4